MTHSDSVVDSACACGSNDSPQQALLDCEAESFSPSLLVHPLLLLSVQSIVSHTQNLVGERGGRGRGEGGGGYTHTVTAFDSL